MDIKIRAEGLGVVKPYLAGIRNVLPDIQAIALNRTAEDILAEQRKEVLKNFKVRAPNFVLPPQRLPREWQAHKRQGTNMRSVVGLGPVGDQMAERRRRILEPFESGKPKVGGRFGPVAIPTSFLRPNIMALVPAAKYPRNIVGIFNNKGEYQGLGTKARIATRTRKALNQKKGKAVGRYFVLGTSQDRAWGIYERVSGDNIRKLWNFRPQVARGARLHFESTAVRVFAERWEPNLIGSYELKTKRV